MKYIVVLTFYVIAFYTKALEANNNTFCERKVGYYHELTTLMLNERIKTIDQFLTSDLAKKIKKESKISKKNEQKFLALIYKLSRALESNVISEEVKAQSLKIMVNQKISNSEEFKNKVFEQLDKKTEEMKVDCLAEE